MNYSSYLLRSMVHEHDIENREYFVSCPKHQDAIVKVSDNGCTCNCKTYIASKTGECVHLFVFLIWMYNKQGYRVEIKNKPINKDRLTEFVELNTVVLVPTPLEDGYAIDQTTSADPYWDVPAGTMSLDEINSFLFDHNPSPMTKQIANQYTVNIMNTLEWFKKKGCDAELLETDEVKLTLKNKWVAYKFSSDNYLSNVMAEFRESLGSILGPNVLNRLIMVINSGEGPSFVLFRSDTSSIIPELPVVTDTYGDEFVWEVGLNGEVIIPFDELLEFGPMAGQPLGKSTSQRFKQIIQG